MSNTRREFLQSSAALAMGVIGGAATKLTAEQPAGSKATQTPASQVPTANVQIPKMKFGNVEISRLVLGHNPFSGFAHFNLTLSQEMTNWYTQDAVCALLHRANSFGINAFNYSDNCEDPANANRAAEDWARFTDEGGKMYVIAGDSNVDPAATLKLAERLKPLAMHRHGMTVDHAFRDGKMDSVVKDWCKRVRDTGVMVGIGTHNPKVIEFVEEQGWDVDFYAACVYNLTRTTEEMKQMLGGELPELSSEFFLQSDPDRMYKAIRQTSKPCFAFKILAAGRIEDDGAVKEAFRRAYTSIKPNDGAYIGIYSKHKDQLKEDAEIVHGILTGA